MTIKLYSQNSNKNQNATDWKIEGLNYWVEERKKKLNLQKF